MKKLLLTLALVGVAGMAMAQQVSLSREPLGSGTPGLKGSEEAVKWDNDIFHAPQYLPGFPTAATIWPRVVDVKCLQVGKNLNCDGYNWLPELGRGEYLLVRPVIVTPLAPPAPVVTTVVKEVPTIVYKEVPVKKKGE